MYLVAIAWMYVAVMMAVAEVSHPDGTYLGAFFTFLLYGLLPLSLVMYLLATPRRREARRAREAAEAAAAQAARAAAVSGPSTVVDPDAGGHAPAAAEGARIAPVREEP